MRDKVTIFGGLAVFVVLATFPFWYTVWAGADTAGSDPVLPDSSDRSLFEKDQDYHCVEKNMVARHMDLLDQWRNTVVRGDGQKQYHESEDFPGERYEMSLTTTCMRCHTSRETFCTRCHEYANVLPLGPWRKSATAKRAPRGIGCWDCHVAPKGD